jgi:hypothetical protein
MKIARSFLSVIPGRLAEANPESRDSGLGPLDRPGMTEPIRITNASETP